MKRAFVYTMAVIILVIVSITITIGGAIEYRTANEQIEILKNRLSTRSFDLMDCESHARHITLGGILEYPAEQQRKFSTFTLHAQLPDGTIGAAKCNVVATRRSGMRVDFVAPSSCFDRTEKNFLLGTTEETMGSYHLAEVVEETGNGTAMLRVNNMQWVIDFVLPPPGLY